MRDRLSGPKAIGILGIVLLSASTARAADYETLARLLYSPYLAQNYSIMCTLRDRGFHEQTTGPRGSMLAYAQHIKEEVIASLESATAQSIMVKAADAAKAKALAEIHALANGGAVGSSAISDWCERHAKPFVRGVISTHEKRHADFERLVAGAKN